jgi:hypothetical protein
MSMACGRLYSCGFGRLCAGRGLLCCFANAAPGAGKKGEGDTLGDRIGARTWSRLQEMCRPIQMTGADHRVRRPG